MEATAPVSEILAVSRKYEVSVTVLLTAVLLCAIHREMTKMQEKRPVVLMVPVNLRKIFPSDSMLNFFSYIEPGYRFGEGEDSFDQVLQAVKQYFAEHLTKEEIAGRMNETIAFEKNRILKWAPLALKNPCIKVGAKMAESEVTAVLSNMSAVKMPEGYREYIERFGVYTSTPRTELCVCSFEDTMTFGFTSRYDSSNIQRNFYELLEEVGVKVSIAEPDYPENVKPNYEGRKFFRGFSFGCVAAAVFAAMANVIFTPDRYWCIFIFAGILSMWTTLSTGYLKRHNLLKNAAWELFVVTLGCIVWDICTGWHGWSVDFVLPLFCLLAQISMLIISKIQSHSPREYMIYYVIASTYGMLLPFLLLVLKVIVHRAPAVLCVGLSFLFLAALVLFRGKEFREEMHKKLHV